MTVIQNASLQRANLPGIEHVTLAGSDNGLRHLSIWRQSIAPGGATPPHRHDCEEIVLVHAGRGELELNGHVHAFGPDTTLVIARNATHLIRNVGTESLQVTGIFSVSPVAVSLPDGRPLDLPWRS